MAEYQARLLTRTGAAGPILNVLPTYERGLSNTGSCEISVSLDHPALTAASIEPWANEILLLRRETRTSAWTVAHDGPVTYSECDDDAGTVTLKAGPVSDWMRMRFQRRDVDVSELDDIDDIAASFIFLAQHPTAPSFPFDADADFGVTAASNPTGVTRPFNLSFQARRNWLEVLNELAQGNPGFDWDIETTWVANVRTRTFRTWSPARGAVIDTPIVRGQGARGLKLINDGTQAANWVESFGSDGTTLVSDPAEDVATQTTHGLLEILDTASDINVKARLDDRAAEQVRIRKPPVKLVQAAYDVSENLPFRFATLGDTCTVKGTRGPMSINSSLRIVNEKITVTDGGREKVDLTFQEPL